MRSTHKKLRGLFKRDVLNATVETTGVIFCAVTRLPAMVFDLRDRLGRRRHTPRTSVLRIGRRELNYPAFLLACLRLDAFGSSASMDFISSGKYFSICLSRSALRRVVTSS